MSRKPSSVIIPVNSPDGNELPDRPYENVKAWNKIFEDYSILWKKWKNNNNANACFGPGGFDYGIYGKANFLQALGRRKLEMSVRGLDIEQWMRYRQFPEELKRQIRESERCNWLATRGVDETMLLD
ncbi:hypothetical protein AgCh_002765 [Apium graveolens]